LGAEMLDWLNDKMERMIFVSYEKITKKTALIIALVLVLASLFALVIKKLNLITPLVAPVPIDMTLSNIIYTVILAPITEEFTTRVILVYFIGLMAINGLLKNAATCGSEGKTYISSLIKKIHTKNVLILVGVLIGVLYNFHIIKTDGSLLQLKKYVGYILFLALFFFTLNLKEKFNGLLFFVLIFGSSLFFAWLHPDQSLFFGFFAFALINCWFTIKTRSVLLPIVIHFWNNFNNVILSLF
jgi:hypothetical protein